MKLVLNCAFAAAVGGAVGVTVWQLVRMISWIPTIPIPHWSAVFFAGVGAGIGIGLTIGAGE